jgi:protein gp37
MNSTSIDWTDLSCNPVTGCEHACPYCYARTIAQRFGGPDGFRPTLHPERLDEIRDTARKRYRERKAVFLCSMSDLWGKWVPQEWIDGTLAAIAAAHSALEWITLTKAPARMVEARRSPAWPERMHGGITLEAVVGRQLERLAVLQASGLDGWTISLEPWREHGLPTDDRWLDGVGWLIVGPQTGPGAEKFQPPAEAVHAVVAQAHARCVPVFCKPSTAYAYPDGGMPREVPAWHPFAARAPLAVQPDQIPLAR